MNSNFHELTIRQLTEYSMLETEKLFTEYPYKDFQLSQLNIPKEKITVFLRETLYGKQIYNAGLREDGKLVGLLSARYQPWISQLFGVNMYSLQHFITSDREPGHYQAMLNYIMDQIADLDFLDCRVSSADISAIQALENAGFRFVGNEVYMVRPLVETPLPKSYGLTECIPCSDSLKTQVLNMVREIHFHNRYMYDPEVARKDAIDIYSKYLSGVAFKPEYRSLIKCDGDRVVGFIFYKLNTALSQLVDGKYASFDFIGVNREIQNSGVGEDLNKAALFELERSGVTHVVVRTFGNNYPAIRICQKVGFKITSSDLHFHLWVRPQAQSKHRLHSSGQPFVDKCAIG